MRGLGRGPPGRSPPSAAGRGLAPALPTPNGFLGPGFGAPGRAAGAGLGPGFGAAAARLAASACSCWRLTSSSARFCSAATSMSRALVGLASAGAGAGAGFGPGFGAAAPGFGAAFFTAFFASASAFASDLASLASTLACMILDGLGAAGRGPLGAAALAGSGVGDSVFPADAAGAPCAASYSCRSRRATGASTVLDADFTNSPMSPRRASSSLLVVPSSLASSCTRGFAATALLNSRSYGQRPPTLSTD